MFPFFPNAQVYWVGPIAGGALASVIYKYVISPYRGIKSVDQAIREMREYSATSRAALSLPFTMCPLAEKFKHAKLKVSLLILSHDKFITLTMHLFVKSD